MKVLRYIYCITLLLTVMFVSAARPDGNWSDHR